MRSAKRFSMILAAATVAWGAWAQAAPLIPNGGFDNGFTGWNTYPDGTGGVAVQADAGPTGFGDFAVHVTSPDWAYPVYSNWITPAPEDQGVPYVASFDVKLGSFDGNKQTDIALQSDWGGNYASTVVTQADASLADGAWHHVSWPVTLNGSNFRFVTYTEGGGGTRDIYFDNFSVGAVPEPATLSLLGLAASGLLLRRKH